MPTLEFRRCHYISIEDIECENTFPVMDDEKIILCELHRTITNVELAQQDEEIKSDYLRARKEHELTCLSMFNHGGFDELERHIGQIEELIETLRMKFAVAKGTKQAKLLELSDEEQAIRRKIKVVKSEAPAKVKKEKISPKNNPIGYLMETFGMSRVDAEALAKKNGAKI